VQTDASKDDPQPKCQRRKKKQNGKAAQPGGQSRKTTEAAGTNKTKNHDWVATPNSLLLAVALPTTRLPSPKENPQTGAQRRKTTMMLEPKPEVQPHTFFSN